VRAWKAVSGESPILVRGKGARVWDADGGSYIDLVGSFGPHILGHAHPAIGRAIRRALAQGGPFGATHPSEVILAERIRAAMPSLERIRFTSSGTEAAMSALRVARAATDRRLIPKFAGGYHGHADALLARAGSGLATAGVPDSAGVDAAVTHGTLVVPYNDLAAVDAAFMARPRSIAAVIVEPVAANMGVVPPQPGFLEGLRKACDDAGALLIFDEVITGFRVDRGGAQALVGVTPDLSCFGKVIGGGLPLAAVGGRADVMAVLAPEGPVYQAGTLSGNPLATAAGLAVLGELDDGAYRMLAGRAEMLGGWLTDVIAESGLPIRVPVVGPLLGLYFATDEPRDYDGAKRTDEALYAAFFHALLDRGVAVAPGAYEVLFPGLAHTKDELERVADLASAAAMEVAASGRTGA
jgi:glutamate-1-semialdehyde 2,1-aminomutase